MNVSFHNVTSLPANPEPGGIYMVGSVEKHIVIIDADGNQCVIGTRIYAHSIAIDGDVHGRLYLLLYSSSPDVITQISDLPARQISASGYIEVDGDSYDVDFVMPQFTGTEFTGLLCTGYTSAGGGVYQTTLLASRLSNTIDDVVQVI